LINFTFCTPRYKILYLTNNSHTSYFLLGGNIVKATGIVRRIDDLGRIVIPKEIRRTLRIREGDPLLTTLTESENVGKTDLFALVLKKLLNT
jgi:AbrB family looped-hinge helix DNA binding protein